MNVEISRAVKMFFPKTSLTMVYFEALANALDANATKIDIDIEIDSFDMANTLKITISDNGDGFTDENFERFKTLLKPRDKYHKGLGRLVFLHYFDQIEISSIWGKNQRNFIFKKDFEGNAPLQTFETEQKNNTSLVFTCFSGERIKSYDDIKPNVLCQSIIEQFLPTLDMLKREDKAFEISIGLETDESNRQKDFFPHKVKITPNDVPVMNKVTIQDESLDVISSIDMLFHIEEMPNDRRSLVAFSIDRRTVPEKIIPASSFPLGYWCVFLFESEAFGLHSDSSRQKVIFPDGLEEQIFYVLRRQIGEVLSEKIPQIEEKNKETKETLEGIFPHLLGYFDKDVVGLIDQDDALSDAQGKFFREQKKVLQSETLNESIYEKSLELSSRALTEYILYRNMIIGRMKAMTEEDSEFSIHDLIVPRKRKFLQNTMSSDIYQNNAWLLDEKFMTFQTILSDKTMDAAINAIRLDEESVGNAGKPDISMIFSGNPDEIDDVDVVIVELKKKTDSEKENINAINQLLDRADKLATHCENIQRIWYYAVVQISDSLAVRLRQLKWVPLFSKRKVFYQEFDTINPDEKIVPTPVFIVSFDAIIEDAESRNHAFLEILRAGMKKYAEDQTKTKFSDNH